MKIRQRDVVEVYFEVERDKLKIHPGVVISTDQVLETEGEFFCVMLSTKETNPDFVFELTEDMFVGKAHRSSFAKCQVIEPFSPEDVVKRTGSIKTAAFRQLIEKLNQSVFGFECE